MRNIKTNHTGLAAVNLYLNNMHVMNKYYLRHRKDVDYPIYWRRRIKNTLMALLFGWTPLQLRTEKQWARAVDKRVRGY